MIRINLAPLEELENKLWFLPDLVVLTLVASVSWFGLQLYTSNVKAEIESYEQETNEFNKNTRRLQPELKRFDQLNKQVELLKEKLKSLERITISKIERYKPIILLEHLQNIKPEGVWFSHLSNDSKNSVIHIVGGAFDNLLVAEFMSALGSTRLQEADITDMRSQIYFKEVHLDRVASTGPNSQGQQNNQTRTQTVQITDPALKGGKGARHWQDSQLQFPEISSFPVFELALKYAERGGVSEPIKAP